MERKTPLLGGIEAGGTKFVCAIGTSSPDVREEIRFPTSDPVSTLAKAINWFQDQESVHGVIASIGVATFGPADVNPASPNFGHILDTPKESWTGADIVGPIKSAFPSASVVFDTDVNAPAMAEVRWGAAQGLEHVVYLTVGTGIGGGAVVGGRAVHGALHPEMGHILIPRDLSLDPFEGCCPFHGDCFEGLASGTAMGKRWGQPAETLPPDHEAWDLEADYLAAGVINLTCTLSPQRIILGGGVMLQEQLFPVIRQKVAERLGGYLGSVPELADLDSYIVPPGLGNRAGIFGAFLLAELGLAVAT